MMKIIENIKYKKYIITGCILIIILFFGCFFIQHKNKYVCNENKIISYQDLKNISVSLKLKKEFGVQIWKKDFFGFHYDFLLEKQQNFPLCELIDLLVIDLKRPDREFALRMHSSPEGTEDLVMNIESGKFLLKIGATYPEFQQYIGDVLYQHIIKSKSQLHVSSIQNNSKKYNLNNTIKGIFVYYLSELEVQSGLYWDLKSKYLKYIIEPRPINYFDYYLKRAYE